MRASKAGCGAMSRGSGRSLEGSGPYAYARRLSGARSPARARRRFPYLLAQRGRRSTSTPRRSPWEKPAQTSPTSTGGSSACSSTPGSSCSRKHASAATPTASGRACRPASALCERPVHLVLLATSTRLVRGGPVYRGVLAAQVALLLAALRPGVARYYVVVTWASVPALLNYFRAGVSAAGRRRRGRGDACRTRSQASASLERGPPDCGGQHLPADCTVGDGERPSSWKRRFRRTCSRSTRSGSASACPGSPSPARARRSSTCRSRPGHQREAGTRPRRAGPYRELVCPETGNDETESLCGSILAMKSIVSRMVFGVSFGWRWRNLHQTRRSLAFASATALSTCSSVIPFWV